MPAILGLAAALVAVAATAWLSMRVISPSRDVISLATPQRVRATWVTVVAWAALVASGGVALGAILLLSFLFTTGSH